MVIRIMVYRNGWTPAVVYVYYYDRREGLKVTCLAVSSRWVQYLNNNGNLKTKQIKKAQLAWLEKWN